MSRNVNMVNIMIKITFNFADNAVLMMYILSYYDDFVI